MTFFSVWIFWIMLNVNETCSTQQNIILMNCSRNVELLVFASWMAANSSLLGTLEHGRFFLLAWLSCDVGYGQQQCHSLCGSCFSKSHQWFDQATIERDWSYIEKSALNLSVQQWLTLKIHFLVHVSCILLFFSFNYTWASYTRLTHHCLWSCATWASTQSLDFGRVQVSKYFYFPRNVNHSCSVSNCQSQIELTMN